MLECEWTASRSQGDHNLVRATRSAGINVFPANDPWLVNYIYVLSIQPGARCDESSLMNNVLLIRLNALTVHCLS